MSGRKRKSVIDFKEVADYRQKLPRPGSAPLKLTNRERKKFTVKSPYIQEFSLPENIIYYIVRNPAFGNGHLKLISSCKSLLRLNRILPVKKLGYLLQNNSSDDEESDEDDKDDEDEESDEDDEDDCYKWVAGCGAQINLENQFFKLWIYDAIEISSGIPNIASTLVRHIHKFTLRRIIIENQVLTFEELQILVSGGNLQEIEFGENVVKNDDGSITEFEKVFELLCCKIIEICFPDGEHGIGNSTTNKIIEILSSDQIPAESDIFLANIPESFDISSFSEFLKANMTGRQHSFKIDFRDAISDAYINRLQQFVNEIIQMRGIYAHTIPLISFRGENDDAFDKIWEMHYGNVEGILRKS